MGKKKEKVESVANIFSTFLKVYFLKLPQESGEIMQKKRSYPHSRLSLACRYLCDFGHKRNWKKPLFELEHFHGF
jgi:hypothetical protein